MRFPDNFQIEKNLHLANKHRYIAGVDEVGRGPLAGPLVVAAVILDIAELLDFEESLSDKDAGSKNCRNNDVEYIHKAIYKNITDSKKISPLKRHKTNDFILEKCLSHSIIKIESYNIDREGMGNAVLRAFNEAVLGLKIKPDFVITDSVKITGLDSDTQLNLVSGDLKSISVGAASIIAKVFRDNIMTEYDTIFPAYGFGKHKGYGTKAHLEALEKHGPCEIHRKSFHPVSKWV